MRKYFPTICSIIMILTVGGVIFMPHTAHAILLDLIPTSVINDTLASFVNLVLAGTSWFVTVTGILLSVSINITTHIKDIYTNVSGIQSVWVTVRDISSMFIIFMLLNSAIRMIIGVDGPKFGRLIVSIFLAGVFINFSLFFVKIAIDASNLVSLQFYEAIAPNTAQNWKVGDAFSDGGLSDVFMQSLKLPRIYKATNFAQASDVTTGIIFAGIGGIVMMLTAGFSFLAASIAFTARTGILLFAMALSPIYFVGMVFPQVKTQVDKYMKVVKGQLVFMPVYLFLMYVALKIISDPMFMTIFNPTTNGGASSFTSFGPVTIGVIVQYVIAILFINAPLVTAFGMAGTEVMGKWSPTAIARDWTGRLSGVIGRRTLGAAGEKIGKGFDKMAASAQRSADQGSLLAKSAIWTTRATRLSQATRAGLTNLEKGKFGGHYSRKDIEKEDKDRKKEVRKVSLKQDLDAAIENGDKKAVKDVLEKMSDAEIAALGAKTLKDENVIPHLSSSVYSAVQRSDKDEKEKVEIAEARKKLLKGASTGKDGAKKDPETVEKIMKSMSGDDVVEIIENWDTKNDGEIPDDIIAHIKPSHLKEMEKLPDELRHKIGSTIADWGNKKNATHPAFKEVNKNQALWGLTDSGRPKNKEASRPEDIQFL